MVRASGACERCGKHLISFAVGSPQPVAPYSIHHRTPRGEGGTRRAELNQPGNLVLLCGTATTPDGCHAAVESNRTQARAEHWLISQHTNTDPTTVPIQLWTGHTVYLTNEGTYQEAAA